MSKPAAHQFNLEGIDRIGWRSALTKNQTHTQSIQVTPSNRSRHSRSESNFLELSFVQNRANQQIDHFLEEQQLLLVNQFRFEEIKVLRCSIRNNLLDNLIQIIITDHLLLQITVQMRNQLLANEG